MSLRGLKMLRRLSANYTDYANHDSQQRFFEHVSDGNLEKCLKFLERGLDPNFIHRASGHTPLTKAVLGKEPKRMIMLLCRYGAFLEFRDRNGYTALHHASINGKHESMQVLLDVGASVNSRDLKGMTPLYNAICDGNSTLTAEILLKEKCDLNIVDNTGQWNELHQACKRGKTDLVELLILYGSEINARTSAGNSALHISASFNKVHCARQLLYRGIDKTIRNRAGQTAYEVAALTSNFVIMDDITNFKPEQAEPFSTTPSYTNRKKEPVFAREGSVSSNKSSGSEQKKAPGHTRTVSAGAAVQRSSSIKTESRNKQNNVPVEPTRTNSVGASSSASSTASSVRALPAEFPAPSNTTLQMTLEELIKTARVCKIPKTKRGYGFHVKGLAEKKKEFTPSVEAPCSQFMFGVDQDSESCKAGVLPDDFIYKVNGKDVSVASHKEVVELIKKSGDPLHLSLIQVSKNLPVQAPPPAATTTPTTSPAATPTAVAPPPAVPKRDPKTRLKGPRLSLSTRSNTISGPVTNNADNNGEESIYDNIKRPTATVPASAESESSRPPPPPAPAPAFVPRKLERMNSAPGGAARADGYKRSNTMPVKPPSSIKEEQGTYMPSEIMTLSRLSTSTPPPRSSFSSRRRSTYQTLTGGIVEEDESESEPDFMSHINRYHTLSAAQIDALKRKAKDDEENGNESHKNRYRTMSAAEINLIKRTVRVEEADERRSMRSDGSGWGSMCSLSDQKEEIDDNKSVSFRSDSGDWGSLSSLSRFVDTAEMSTQTNVTSSTQTSPHVSPENSPSQPARREASVRDQTDMDSSASTISLPTPTNEPPKIGSVINVADPIYTTPKTVGTSTSSRSSQAIEVDESRPPPPKRSSTLSKITVQKPPRSNAGGQKAGQKLVHTTSAPHVSTQCLPDPPARSSSMSQNTQPPTPVRSSSTSKKNLSVPVKSTSSSQNTQSTAQEKATSGSQKSQDKSTVRSNQSSSAARSSSIKSISTTTKTYPSAPPKTSSLSRKSQPSSSVKTSVTKRTSTQPSKAVKHEDPKVSEVEIDLLPPPPPELHHLTNSPTTVLLTSRDLKSNSKTHLVSTNLSSQNNKPPTVELKKVELDVLPKEVLVDKDQDKDNVKLKKVDTNSLEKPPVPKEVDNTKYRTTAITKAAIFGTVSVRVRPTSLERMKSSEKSGAGEPSGIVEEKRSVDGQTKSKNDTKKSSKKSKKSKKSTKKKDEKEKSSSKKSSDRSWTCESCQISNPTSKDFCDKCHMPRKQLWLCPDCDKYNSRSKCSGCKKV
ncbi:hypothetical protein ACHWQZ_G009945 [Mnemiopsis leidyi]